MSILRDLDPQNARFSESATATKSRKILWAMMLLLLIAAATWLFLRFQFSKNISADDRPPELAATMKENNSGISNHIAAPTTDTVESAQAPSTVQSAPAPSEASKTGAALIQTSTLSQSDGRHDKNIGPNVFQTMQMELEKPRDKQPVAKQKLADMSTQEKHQANGKPATTASTKKSAGNSTASQSADSAQLMKNTKKPAERDIDIITAIVR